MKNRKGDFMSKRILKLNLQHFAEGVTPPEPQPTQQPTPQQPMQQPTQQPNLSELVNGLSDRINQTLDQRLAPIEQRLNQPQPMTQEQIEQQNETIRQQFENNPMEFVKNIQEQAKTQAMSEFQQKYDPIIKNTEQLGNRLQWQDQVRQFTGQNPDAAKALPEIAQILQENPALMGTKDPLGTAYRLSNKLMANGNPVDSILAK